MNPLSNTFWQTVWLSYEHFLYSTCFEYFDFKQAWNPVQTFEARAWIVWHKYESISACSVWKYHSMSSMHRFESIVSSLDNLGTTDRLREILCDYCEIMHNFFRMWTLFFKLELLGSCEWCSRFKNYSRFDHKIPLTSSI